MSEFMCNINIIAHNLILSCQSEHNRYNELNETDLIYVLENIRKTDFLPGKIIVNSLINTLKRFQGDIEVLCQFIIEEENSSDLMFYKNLLQDIKELIKLMNIYRAGKKIDSNLEIKKKYTVINEISEKNQPQLVYINIANFCISSKSIAVAISDFFSFFNACFSKNPSPSPFNIKSI